jgi:methionine aminotransferase
MPLESKLPDVGVTIFTQMTQLANQAGAVNLSQGFPDFDPPLELKQRVIHYMNAGHNQYAPMQGALALRERIAAKTQQLYGASYDPVEEITVTSGATEALFAAITAVVRPGDEVIICEPAYDAYVPVVTLNGGIPVYTRYRYPDYRLDWDHVRACLSSRTRLLILNSPHNPTGAVWTQDDIDALKTIVAEHPLWIVSDEVYEHIVFDGARHLSLASYPELAQRSFVISSFGKTYHATGWKIGYCLAPSALTRELQRIHQYLTFASNTPVQMAYADYLAHDRSFLDLPNFYQAKRDLFIELLAASAFNPLPCPGTYFLMVDYSAIATEADTRFARWLTTDHKVAAIPPSVFYHRQRDHHVLRFCFAKTDETLKQAAQRLCQI